jgi:hypothetical protein
MRLTVAWGDGSMLFHKKRKNTLFGGDIPPDCAYCRHNSGRQGQVLCALRCTMTDGKCRQYAYDPLLREPRPAPSLQTEQFSEEDFKL